MTGDSDFPLRLDRSQTPPGHTDKLLRKMVLDGSIPPGERLDEVELAAALGVSRAPLRAAVQRLADEGLLTVVSPGAAYVRTFDAGELRELYELRISLESYAVRLAARHATKEDLEEVADLLRRTQERLVAEDSVYPRDLDFHRSIVALSGNRLLLRSALEVQQQIQLARTHVGGDHTSARDAYSEHEYIFDALAAGDDMQASLLLEEHLTQLLDNVMALHLTGPSFQPVPGETHPGPGHRHTGGTPY